jgi:hypothetical protein
LLDRLVELWASLLDALGLNGARTPASDASHSVQRLAARGTSARQLGHILYAPRVERPRMRWLMR